METERRDLAKRDSVGEKAGIGDILGGSVETQCNDNFLESTRVALLRSPSNEGYGA